MVEFIEILLIAFTIFFESSGESVDSKIAHAWTIKNRVDHVLFADSYSSVIFKPKHFSCYNPDQIKKHILRLNFKTFVECFAIADGVYCGRIKDNTNLDGLGGALWYTAKYEFKEGRKVLLRRAWMKDLEICAEYDNTVFYRLKILKVK